MQALQFSYSPTADFPASLLWVIPHVNRSRASYLDILEGLPPAFRDFAARHFSQRIQRGKYRPHIGEYLPWLLADVLKTPRSNRVDVTISGWLSVYFGVLLLDDVLDGVIRPSADELLTSALLQQRGISRMLSASPKPLKLQRSLDVAFARTAVAARCEMDRRSRNIIPFQQGEMAALADKGAILASCADALALLSPVSGATRRAVLGFLRPLLAALQLLDDINDCAEDQAMGAVTVPLSLHAENRRERGANPGKRRDDELLAAMILDGSLIESIRTVSSFLEPAIRKAGAHRFFADTRIRAYTAELKRRTDEALNAVVDSRAEIDNLHGSCDQVSPELRAALRRIRRRLIIIMQST